MRSIASLVSILVVALIAGMFCKFYFSQAQSAAGGTTPAQTIDIVGVKNDLIAIAQAERTYQVEHSSYASLNDLVSSGALSMKKPGRDGYTYDVSTSGDSFRVIANCPAATYPGCANYTIDQNMEVRSYVP
jgi:hypothetical protein